MRSFIFVSLLGTVLSCKAQTKEGSAVKISGTVVKSTGGYAYFEQLNDRGIATKIDSVKIQTGNKFEINTAIKEPGFYQLNIGNAQRVVLVLDGGENLTIQAEGQDQPDKRGFVKIEGSKPMEHFLAINAMSADMQSKVAQWQLDYQAASAKKNQAKMQEIQKRFEVEQRTLVDKIKVVMPELGTSLVALWATNFMSMDEDFALYDDLATKLEAEGKKYPIAIQFINAVKRKKGTTLGQEAPNFSLKTLSGETVSLADLKGKIVILDFWATWCRPCLMSFPGMQKAIEKYKSNPEVQFYFVDTFERVGPDAVTKHVSDFVKNRGNMGNMSILMDTDSQVATGFSVNGIPAKFCIDKTGKIIKKSEGYLGSDEAIVEEIDEWVAAASK